MRALISVYDKGGLEELLPVLVEKGYELISTGGTYKYIQDLGYEVLTAEEITGHPEILEGRVKTLHPKIHGGILARREIESHLEDLKENRIQAIDLVICNLYPFFEKVKEEIGYEEKIEFIDIGGPSMLRSAAKNHKDVLVLSSPTQYDEFIQRLKENRFDHEYRRRLAAEVFALTASYDSAIANFLCLEVYPPTLTLSFEKRADLRYGENPHQRGAFYADVNDDGFLTKLSILWGKELSYNNYRDMEICWEVVTDFDEICAVAVKHNTPCGVALADSAFEAYSKAHACDPVSIFGGIVALNVEVDAQTAEEMNKTFLEIVMAPSFTEEALEILKQKKNLRIIAVHTTAPVRRSLMSLGGGLLVQEKDLNFSTNLNCVTRRCPDDEQLSEMLFAMKVAKYVKSNAIVVSCDKAAVGIGGGSVNRIDAARFALERGRGATVLASDAFFPFDDVVRLAAGYGIEAIIQPGGSQRDQDSIDACNESGIAMIFTGMRHFKH